MIYKDFKDKKLSALGLGCMRFPVKEDKSIDEAATAELVETAMRAGINYYDTAWGYHNGTSESVIGRILKKHPRDSFYLATKFPGYERSNIEKKEEIFEAQLERCQVDYFDFYLFHNVCEQNIEFYLDRSLGLCDYLVAQKNAGRIRHLGFSLHGSMETTRRFLEAYGEHMEFCQIQLNWLDWDYQKACDKIRLFRERNIPVWVMEPLRGGKLANLSEAEMEKLSALRPGKTAANWGLRYLQTIPELVVTLSGMSNMEQLQENIDIYSSEEPLNEQEVNALQEIAAEWRRVNTVPCTACSYCTSYCPQNLNIPQLLEMYNEYKMSGSVPFALGRTPEEQWPTACVGCHACEAVCPQLIKIADVMSAFAAAAK